MTERDWILIAVILWMVVGWSITVFSVMAAPLVSSQMTTLRTVVYVCLGTIFGPLVVVLVIFYNRFFVRK